MFAAGAVQLVGYVRPHQVPARLLVVIYVWAQIPLFSAVQARTERPPKRCVRACACTRALSCALVPLLMNVMLLLLKLV
jgi:hypothetical protein